MGKAGRDGSIPDKIRAKIASFIGLNQTASTIQNSSSKLTVTGDTYAAGLVAVENGSSITIESSYYNGTLELLDTGYMGGLVGIFNGGASSISNSYSSGSYTAESTPYWVGGLVGIFNGSSEFTKIKCKRISLILYFISGIGF